MFYAKDQSHIQEDCVSRKSLRGREQQQVAETVNQLVGSHNLSPAFIRTLVMPLYPVDHTAAHVCLHLSLQNPCMGVPVLLSLVACILVKMSLLLLSPSH